MFMISLGEQEAVFFKSQTKIQDDEELRQHIIDVQKKAYAVHPYRCILTFSFTGSGYIQNQTGFLAKRHPTD